VTSAQALKTKVEALIKTNNWTNITVVDLSPNPCNISFAEAVYGIAGAKSTKSVVNTVAETYDTAGSAIQSTTSTLKSTGWTTASYYDLTKDAKEADVTEKGTDTETAATTTSGKIETSDDTTTTVTHYRHPLVITNRLQDGVVYDTVLV
jgi:hypothetical protein